MLSIRRGSLLDQRNNISSFRLKGTLRCFCCIFPKVLTPGETDYKVPNQAKPWQALVRGHILASQGNHLKCSLFLILFKNNWSCSVLLNTLHLGTEVIHLKFLVIVLLASKLLFFKPPFPHVSNSKDKGMYHFLGGIEWRLSDVKYWLGCSIYNESGKYPKYINPIQRSISQILSVGCSYRSV